MPTSPRVRYKGRGRTGGEIGEAPPVADAARRFRGSAPIGGRDSGRESVGTTVGNHRPLRKRYKGCNGRATARVAPTEGYKGCRGERNPPVTASPCQPPLGKRAEGTGEADCHSQCAHWPRNDTVNKRCGANTEGGQRRPPLRSVTRGAAKRGVEDAAPYGCISEGAGGRADVGIGPYEDVTSSAVGYWATARVAPGNDRFLRWFLCVGRRIRYDG